MVVHGGFVQVRFGFQGYCKAHYYIKNQMLGLISLIKKGNYKNKPTPRIQ